MFVHSMSPMCAYVANCTYNLCQLRHPKKKIRYNAEKDDKSTEHETEPVEEEIVDKRSEDSIELEDERIDDDEVYPCDT